jgi:hypothetical protein
MSRFGFALLVVMSVAAAAAVWQWPYALNMLRHARSGWITTVDTAV